MTSIRAGGTRSWQQELKSDDVELFCILNRSILEGRAENEMDMPAGWPIQQNHKMKVWWRVFMEKKKRNSTEGWTVAVHWYGWKKIRKEVMRMKVPFWRYYRVHTLSSLIVLMEISNGMICLLDILGLSFAYDLWLQLAVIISSSNIRSYVYIIFIVHWFSVQAADSYFFESGRQLLILLWDSMDNLIACLDSYGLKYFGQELQFLVLLRGHGNIWCLEVWIGLVNFLNADYVILDLFVKGEKSEIISWCNLTVIDLTIR